MLRGKSMSQIGEEKGERKLGRDRKNDKGRKRKRKIERRKRKRR